MDLRIHDALRSHAPLAPCHAGELGSLRGGKSRGAESLSRAGWSIGGREWITRHPGIRRCQVDDLEGARRFREPYPDWDPLEGPHKVREAVEACLNVREA